MPQRTAIPEPGDTLDLRSKCGKNATWIFSEQRDCVPSPLRDDGLATLDVLTKAGPSTSYACGSPVQASSPVADHVAPDVLWHAVPGARGPRPARSMRAGCVPLRCALSRTPRGTVLILTHFFTMRGGRRGTVSQPAGCQPYRLPQIEIVDEEPSAYLREVAEEALVDVATGRSVICMSDEAFDALLEVLSVDSATS